MRRNSMIREMTAFANGPLNKYQSIKNTIRLPLSNGQLKGLEISYRPSGGKYVLGLVLNDRKKA